MKSSRIRRMPMNAKTNNMTPKMALFCREYLKDFNAARAAIAAGYAEKGARQTGSRLLTYVDIQKAISEALKGRMKRVEVDAEWVLQNAVNLFKMSVGDFLKFDHQN